MKKRVLAMGTFDVLHPGHLLYLEEAKRLGDELWVIVARDSTVRKLKRTPLMPERDRLKMVSSLKIVDRAILGDKKDMFAPLRKIKPAVIALGPNQPFGKEGVEKEIKKIGIKSQVVRIKKLSKGNLRSSSKIQRLLRLCS